MSNKPFLQSAELPTQYLELATVSIWVPLFGLVFSTGMYLAWNCFLGQVLKDKFGPNSFWMYMTTTVYSAGSLLLYYFIVTPILIKLFS